ncbi:hypothetical protein DESC_480241 [Desulfosarcina cetonica]|nr:hypothetical protein DESC_480241 [Desulfosarcina cetonica]
MAPYQTRILTLRWIRLSIDDVYILDILALFSSPRGSGGLTPIRYRKTCVPKGIGINHKSKSYWSCSYEAAFSCQVSP